MALSLTDRKPMSLLIAIPFQEPVAAFAPFAEDPWAMLLDSPVADDARGRYAYLALSPTRTLLARGGEILLDGQKVEGDPLSLLAGMLASGPPPLVQPPLPFAGGAVGLFGYGLGRRLEYLPTRHGEQEVDLAVGLYDLVVGYDRLARRGWIIASTPQAAARAGKLAATLAKPADLPPPPIPDLRAEPELTRDDYLRRVEAVIAYIRAGDIFQANFTQRFLAPRPTELRPFDFYRRLRAANPAPFAAFLNCGGDFCLASASPERFLRLEKNGHVEARPIKGTRRRSADPGEDREIAADLARSDKECAENLMITDLLRNDLGRVARLGSVLVPVLNRVESTRTLHHLVSVIEARLRPGLGPIELLRASFPGGSVTGAPKIRAMEIIDELEAGPRGAYCGAVAWIGFDGAMDSSIVIRSLAIDGSRIIAQAGGAITALSDPAAEYDEMLAKVAPALTALGGEPSP